MASLYRDSRRYKLIPRDVLSVDRQTLHVVSRSEQNLACLIALVTYFFQGSFVPISVIAENTR